MDNTRLVYCVIYFVLAIAVLLTLFVVKCPDIKELLIANLPLILWCAFWGAFGIALGLWNSRTDNSPSKPCHYITYYPFVWFFATALAIAVSADMNGIRLYALSMVTALAAGFAGDRLAGNIIDSKPQEK